ncbi:MAG: hydantoinase/oxoprolinase family protein [Deltaproteobacteria bacterium]|nr:hydantoinase/oxoprolinase family protein [Candidatus Anaeroferrophillus wilburensis]MBN2889759.1 hydantoinase/oxoprolinase family protein [Deltaproteobacteria bacterium]
MLLGIDVGGTHTDAVIIDRQGVVKAAKVATDHDHLLGSVKLVLREVLQGTNPELIKKINLSTTLTTNAIVEQQLDPVGMVVLAGPGINPQRCRVGSYFFTGSGSIDHRGKEQQPFDPAAVAGFARHCRDNNVRAYAVVTKFSPRNPDHEIALSKLLEPQADFISIGHRLSGRLNFPRRVATAFYNSAIWQSYNCFADAIEHSIAEFGLKARIDILKADGGTMPFAASRFSPVQSILSGPAASVMGIVALCNISEDAVILDIGGTTTDIAIFAAGAPLLENDGIAIDGRPTLVRAIITRSIGIGGDSLIHQTAGNIQVGPRRQGPAMAFGGRQPTLVDACNVMNLCQAGEVSASMSGMADLAGRWGTGVTDVAKQAIDYAVGEICEAAGKLISDLNNQPVYTIHELLAARKLVPEHLYIMGGPAKVLGCTLAKAFDLETTIPEEYSIANAIGAALTRTTMEVELFADTEKKTLLLPNLNIVKQIPFQYSLDEALTDCKNYLGNFLEQCAITDVHKDDIDIVEADSFNMISNYFTVGKNIRVSCQLKPGIQPGYGEGLRNR